MTPFQLLLHKAIVLGELPSETVDVCGVPFTFRLPGHTFHFENLEHLVVFTENHIACDGRLGKEFIRDIPSPLFTVLLSKYREFQEKFLSQLMAAMKEYVETAESKYTWAVFQEVGATLSLEILDGKLNIFQHRWIVENHGMDKRTVNKLVTDVFEAAKPWLDKEMWLKIKENETGIRENAFYDEDAGGELDKEMRRRAEVAMKQKKAQSTAALDEDDDIVTIDKGDV